MLIQGIKNLRGIETQLIIDVLAVARLIQRLLAKKQKARKSEQKHQSGVEGTDFELLCEGFADYQRFYTLCINVV